MKRFLSAFLSVLIMFNASIVAFADDFGGTTVVDFEDIVESIEEAMSFEEEASEEEIVEEAYAEEDSGEESGEESGDTSEDTSIEETTSEETTDSFTEEESELSDEIEDNRDDALGEDDSETTSEESTEEETEITTQASEDFSEETTTETTTVSKPESVGGAEFGKTYTVDFKAITVESGAKMNGWVSDDGIVGIISESDLAYNHASGHGISYYDGDKILVSVAGNSIISFNSCYYTSATAVLNVTDADGNNVGTLENLKTETDGSGISFAYMGEATVLTFTMTNSNAQNYLHAVTVEGIVSGAEKGKTYTADFKALTNESGAKMNGWVSDDGVISILSPNDLAYNHASGHGIAYYDGDEILVSVAGDSEISFSSCAYTSASAIFNITDIYGNSIGTLEGLKVATDGDAVTYTYTGEATVLIFTMANSGATNYLHKVTVTSLLEEATTETTTETTTGVEPTLYVWDLTRDRVINEKEFGLKFTDDFSASGGGTVTDESGESYKYSNSIVALSNNGGFEFTAPANGTFTIAYKINNGKSGEIFGESISNTTGATQYIQRTYEVTAGETYRAYISGSKIQIYYLSFYTEEEISNEPVEEEPVFTIPEDAYKWDLSNGLAGDCGNGLYAGEELAAHKSGNTVYVQGTTNPVIKNRVPKEGAYIKYTASEEGDLYLRAGIGTGKNAIICNNEIYNDTPTDMIHEGVYHLKAGETYYIYCTGSKIKIYDIAFKACTECEELDCKCIDSTLKEGIFTVVIGDEKTDFNTFREAVEFANGNTAKIIVNDNYYLNKDDIPDSSDFYPGWNVRYRVLKLSGEETNVTLMSNTDTKARFSIIRDVEDCYKDGDYGAVYTLENFISVVDGATLTIGDGTDAGGLILDGGFNYDSETRSLSSVVNGVDYSQTRDQYGNALGSFYGPFIVVKNGATVNVNDRVSFARNYSTGEGTDTGVRNNGTWGAMGNTACIDYYASGEKSTVNLNGGEFSQNFGNDLIIANSNLQVNFNKFDVYYNETLGQTGHGAITLVGGAEYLYFPSDCDVQIRSNKNYSSKGVHNNSLKDVQLKSGDININGHIEIGELCLGSWTTSKVNVLTTSKHKYTITIATDNDSFNMNTATGIGSSTGGLNVYVNTLDMTTDLKYFDPNLLVKINGLYYKIRAYEDGDATDGETRVIKFNNIYRDAMLYRENDNNYIGEDLARYGLVIVGGFPWNKDNENYSEMVQRDKYDQIGFDIAIAYEDDFNPNNSPEEEIYSTYVSSNYAWYRGVYWGNQIPAVIDQEYQADNATVVQPITGYALDTFSSPILNFDMEREMYGAGFPWDAHDYCAMYGVEITDIPANVKFWIRKHYVGHSENGEQVVEDLKSEWIFIDSPSLYTTTYALSL